MQALKYYQIGVMARNDISKNKFQSYINARGGIVTKY